ncbi:DUF1284 domain-containing protein [uncultured Litoreibacter sp.]|uniref:DUF1284 domain-containing protein n=1 Tax=uncultured Litoreibacter sp. TaxID=1392394 RepID=UPI003458BF1F
MVQNTAMAPSIRYRPHHFLCSLGFEGKGYSPDFAANMTAIVMGKLRAVGGDQTLIEVVSAADDICAPCPKRRDQLCTAQAKIDRLDAAHAEALNIAAGDVLTWGEAQSRIRANVQPGHLAVICKSCSWLDYGMCEAALRRLHDAPLQDAPTNETPRP